MYHFAKRWGSSSMLRSTVVLASLVASACGGARRLTDLPVPATLHILVSKPSPYFFCDGSVDTGENTAQFTCASSSGTWDVTGILEYERFSDRAQVHIRALPEDVSHYSASAGYPLAIDFDPSESGVEWTGWAAIYPPDEEWGHIGLTAVGWVEGTSGPPGVAKLQGGGHVYDFLE